MMENNWQHFLKNLGEWRGSFTNVSLTGDILGSVPSILTLEGFEENQLVRFRLQRFDSGSYDDPPSQDYVQDYRSVGPQNIFFETGAFSKGPVQFSPFSDFGAEYGFVSGDRRLRFVQLFDKNSELAQLILIREFRQGSQAQERPPLTLEQLWGTWEGKAHQVYADWTPSETYSTQLVIEDLGQNKLQQTLSFAGQTLTSMALVKGQQLEFTSTPQRHFLMLPDGVSTNTPLKLELRQPFFVELGWLVSPTERQRLIRSYDETGRWIYSTFIVEQKR